MPLRTQQSSLRTSHSLNIFAVMFAGQCLPMGQNAVKYGTIWDNRATAPHGEVEFRTELPKSAALKILRRELQQEEMRRAKAG